MTSQILFFVGVTTGKSSILKVFPRWCDILGLDARIEGIDLAPNSAPEAYREAVLRLKNDDRSPGALITTHKLNVYRAARDLFDGISEDAEVLQEINSVSKRDGRFLGHAKDPVTVGNSLDAILPEGYWRRGKAEMLILGAGGSSLALTLCLHRRQIGGVDVPSRIIVTARRRQSLDEMHDAHRRMGFAIPVDYRLAPTPAEADDMLGALPAGSMVVNATGLGKDAPGSPLGDTGIFPREGIVWEFNYRGDLIFLEQARAQSRERALRVADGWTYFVHGWTRVIAEAFRLDIPPAGALFDRLSAAAAAA
jgi:shikimate 5-dehydrogenase